MRHRALFIALLLAVGCAAPTADDLVAEVIATRNEYEVRLSSWIDRSVGTPQAHLYLDVNVVNNGQESLQTLTVLVEQLDADNEVLDSQRAQIDVSGMTSGLSKTTGVEVAPVAPGVEGVRLLIEPDPPAEVWGEFPELERVRPRGR